MVLRAMSVKRSITLFMLIFLLGALPFIAVQPSGSASAGLSAGFALPFENAYHLILFLAVGLAAAVLGRDAIILVPLCFVLMFVVGASFQIEAASFPPIRMFTLGAILLFAIAMSLVGSRLAILCIAIASSAAYHFGISYMAALPEISSPMYFIIGIILALVLIFATSVSFGLTLFSDGDQVVERLKASPSVSSFMSFFL